LGIYRYTASSTTNIILRICVVVDSSNNREFYQKSTIRKTLDIKQALRAGILPDEEYDNKLANIFQDQKKRRLDVIKEATNKLDSYNDPEVILQRKKLMLEVYYDIQKADLKEQERKKSTKKMSPDEADKYFAQKDVIFNRFQFPLRHDNYLNLEDYNPIRIEEHWEFERLMGTIGRGVLVIACVSIALEVAFVVSGGGVLIATIAEATGLYATVAGFTTGGISVMYYALKDDPYGAIKTLLITIGANPLKSIKPDADNLLKINRFIRLSKVVNKIAEGVYSKLEDTLFENMMDAVNTKTDAVIITKTDFSDLFRYEYLPYLYLDE
jgi:predicted secreted protein